MVNLGFWDNLRSADKPILCLAPMADVTDSAFRYVISKNSDIPHVTWTEFVSADGLALAPEEGRKKLLKGLEYIDIERPIVAQFFTSKPENMEKAARLAAELGFDGVDINMGCPDKSVEKQGAGAALIKNPSLAKELVLAAKEGASEYAKKNNKKVMPVSVKTRLGYNKDELESWLLVLLEAEPAVITLHSRTRKEMSKVPARWERVKRAVEIRDGYVDRSDMVGVPKTFIFGNGDVIDLAHAYQLASETGCDGVMLGRAIFGDPFLFFSKKASSLARMRALIEHIQIFDNNLSGFKSFVVMKKHFKSYINNCYIGEDNHVVLGKKNILVGNLMAAKSTIEAIKCIDSYIKSDL